MTTCDKCGTVHNVSAFQFAPFAATVANLCTKCKVLFNLEIYIPKWNVIFEEMYKEAAEWAGTHKVYKTELSMAVDITPEMKEG